mgnify:CR=1 FL=1
MRDRHRYPISAAETAQAGVTVNLVDATLGGEAAVGIQGGGDGQAVGRLTATGAGAILVTASVVIENRILDVAAGELGSGDTSLNLTSLAGHRYQARWVCAGIEPARPLLQDSTVAEPLPQLKAPSEGEQLVADYASTGLSLGRHPMALLRPRLIRLGLQPAQQLHSWPHGNFARTAGIVTGRQSPGSARGVIFITLEDETGIIQVIVWPNLAQRQRRILLGARLLAVAGEVQREGNVLHLIAKGLEDHSHLLGRLITHSRDFH